MEKKLTEQFDTYDLMARSDIATNLDNKYNDYPKIFRNIIVVSPFLLIMYFCYHKSSS